MTITKNCFGELTARMERDGRVYEVVKKKAPPYSIDEVRAWSRGPAYLYPFLDDLEDFPTFLKAVAFMKENIENIM